MRILRSTLLFLVFCLLFSACGSGDSEPSGGDATSDSPSDSSSSDSEPSDGYSSDDGALSLSTPTDGTEITIATVDGGETIGDFTTITTYDLGPDGATFSPALTGRMEVDQEALAGGVTLLHETDDGEIEGLIFEIVDGGLEFELDSFSRVHLATGESSRGAFDVHLSAPNEVAVGEEVPLTFDFRRDDTDLSYNRLTLNSDGYRTTGPISGTGDLFTCDAVGSGLIEYSGVIRAEIPVDQPGGLSFSLSHYRGFAVGKASVEVRCVAPGAVVPPYDTRCTDRATGEPATTCSSPEDLEFTYSFVDGQLSVSLTPPADTEVTHSITQQGDDFRVIEISTDGSTNGFYGRGFQSFTPDGQVPVVDPATGALTGLMIDNTGDGPLVMFPGGPTFEGDTLEPATAPWLDYTIYIDHPDGAFGTYYWNMPAQLLGE